MVPTIDHVLGQEDVIRRFRVALEASWNDGSRLPHMLLTGGPGLGKTMLAHLAARELGVQLHERLAQIVNTPGSLNGLLLQAKDKDVVFLDEVTGPGYADNLFRLDGFTILFDRDRTLNPDQVDSELRTQ